MYQCHLVCVLLDMGIPYVRPIEQLRISPHLREHSGAHSGGETESTLACEKRQTDGRWERENFGKIEKKTVE